MPRARDRPATALMTRVVVIGAGIAGLISAWALSDDVDSVVVHDAGLTGQASPVAAGMLASAAELADGEEALHALAARSVRGWPELAGRLRDAGGVDVGLRDEGTLLLSLHRDDDAELDRHARRLARLGLPAARLDARTCQRLEPALSSAVRAGLRLEDDLSVDTTAVLAALRGALRRRGVEIRSGAVEPVCTGERVTGVRLSSGEVHPADVVVLAAGAHSRPLAARVGLEVGVRPVKGELLRLRTHTPVLTCTLRAQVDGVPVYLVPRRNGEVVIGATSDDCGFDTRRTPRAALDLLLAATAVVPELRDAELVSHDVGLRPGTADNGPYLGEAAPGLVVATGHYRHGYLLAPATVGAVRHAVLGTAAWPEAVPFQPHRPVDQRVGLP
ncbi:glycine oxidase ThiO [Luteipulveratus sp. YIM 133132]|uniref:glycine oxidase ThiO n=1 Tax=Luteipulveratus flavus TaxID=3031728 RepID=UPI0023B03019|nr:glycine oxidase ThiO [Luteipulveratus sp. YIM 133132]MDE9366529.1 glycine oxidase ThiO [Luteipulveratus sp. YIM 133132]